MIRLLPLSVIFKLFVSLLQGFTSKNLDLSLKVTRPLLLVPLRCENQSPGSKTLYPVFIFLLKLTFVPIILFDICCICLNMYIYAWWYL